MVEREDTNLRVFNTAKRYAEEILFPIMETYQRMKRKSDFGCENIDEAILLSEEIRDIERYNGLKGMVDTIGSLLTSITSTVRLKGNLMEIKQLESIKEKIVRIKAIFHEHRERFFNSSYKESSMIDVLNREYFEKIKEIIETCYINVEILMTRNKLLFADSKDDYATDEEIKESILQEYVDG